MKLSLKEELQEIFQAIEIDSKDAFSFSDQVIHTEDPIPGKYSQGNRPPHRLVAHLQQWLYLFAYSRAFHSETLLRRAVNPAISSSEPEPSFLHQLSEANSSRDRWDLDWVVERCLPRGRVLVRKAFLERVLWPGEFLSQDGPGAAPRPGTRLGIFCAREAKEYMPGYYFVFGETPDREEGNNSVVRYYFNISALGASNFLNTLTRCFNRFQLPFRCKVPNHSALYDRRDAAVLYIRRRFAHLAEELGTRVLNTVTHPPEDGVPLFTRRLGPGFAMADDPGNGQSFGQDRCRLLAEGIWSAFEQGTQSGEGRWEAVEKRFRAEGLDLHHPHLNKGSKDVRYVTGQSRSGFVPNTPAPKTFLDAAFSIALRLCRDARWAGGRCNWVGPALVSENSQWKTVHRALGTDVYQGTSGIALFLTRLFRLTDEPLLKTTAHGALAQALSRREGVRSSRQVSFYGGWTGLAHACLEAGEALGEEDLFERGLEIFGDLVLLPAGEAELDVIHGSAGAIAVCLLHSGRFPDALEMAKAHGEKLLSTAREAEVGWSWKTHQEHAEDLCGLSHGASGIGAALLELFHSTDDPRFLEGAENAFRYERQWFNSEFENWPSLSLPARGQGDGHSYNVAWCHGAPGIGLTRLRAFQILGEEMVRQEAEVALRTTERSIEEELRSDQHNYSLCHGLAGNAEVLLDGADVLGVPEYRRLAQEVGQKGMELYEDTRSPWPCGVGDAGESPSLMLGLAGIGHFYLRLHDPEQTPSVLLLTPPGRD